MRNIFSKLALTAALMLAITFTLSCSDYPPLEFPSEDNILCAGFTDGSTREHYGKVKSQFCDPRDGKKYVYVKIGKQTWMAENLNYAVEGSKCYGDDDANCDIYGRLYDWTTAMTVCPTGWHLPSDANWNVLMKFVNPNCSDNSDCIGAGKLKATSRWNNNGNGTDDYGFSALPGGHFDVGLGVYSNVGISEDWWSTSGDANGAHARSVGYDNEDVHSYDHRSNYFFSVRCLKN